MFLLMDSLETDWVKIQIFIHNSPPRLSLRFCIIEVFQGTFKIMYSLRHKYSFPLIQIFSPYFIFLLKKIKNRFLETGQMVCHKKGGEGKI